MFFNTLTYAPGGIINLPSKVGKVLPNGALPLALLLALSVNPKIKLRPNVFLCLVGLLVADGILTATQQAHVGTDYRTFRFIEFFIGLWLLTPWWGRSDMMLFRWHLRLLYIVLISVAVGIIISPGKAFQYGGRLVGSYLANICHSSRSVCGGRGWADDPALARPPRNRACCSRWRRFQRHRSFSLRTRGRLYLDWWWESLLPA